MQVILPAAFGYGRLDTILKLLATIRAEEKTRITLDWTKVEAISPAGFAMLASLFDACVEHRSKLSSKLIKKRFREIPVVKNLIEISSYDSLPKPTIHDSEQKSSLLRGQETFLNLGFIDRFDDKFGKLLGEDLSFSCRLILNELMQNTLDHSTAERYYMYGGLWTAESGRDPRRSPRYGCYNPCEVAAKVRSRKRCRLLGSCPHRGIHYAPGEKGRTRPVPYLRASEEQRWNAHYS